VIGDDEMRRLADRIASTETIELRGVMAVAPLGEEPARAFERVAESSARLQVIHPTATDISAGMSADWEAALEHGATHLRIGTSITGNRPAPR
jgi:uncharacterized pyridoxal phosphate-containing UPF0001 family protein